MRTAEETALNDLEKQHQSAFAVLNQI